MAPPSVIHSRRTGAGFNKVKDPASSLLAAHLAPDPSPGAGREHGISRETFSQLRREILGSDEGDQFRLDDNIGDVLSLICVVIKAGIEPSLKGVAFPNSNEEIKGQTLDCLDIIRLAVQRAPQVLY